MPPVIVNVAFDLSSLYEGWGEGVLKSSQLKQVGIPKQIWLYFRKWTELRNFQHPFVYKNQYIRVYVCVCSLCSDNHLVDLSQISCMVYTGNKFSKLRISADFCFFFFLIRKKGGYQQVLENHWMIMKILLSWCKNICSF